MTEKEYRTTLAKCVTGDVVRLRWRDSSRVHLGWDSITGYEKAMTDMMETLEETVGYFVGSNDGFVMLALNALFRKDDPHVADAMAIPHEAIRSIEILADNLNRGVVE